MMMVMTGSGRVELTGQLVVGGLNLLISFPIAGKRPTFRKERATRATLRRSELV